VDQWRDHDVYDIPEASVNGFIPVVMPDGAKLVLEGTIPAVFVNGMARANPDFRQVADEFERTTRGR
jgi:hypothetical protein